MKKEEKEEAWIGPVFPSLEEGEEEEDAFISLVEKVKRRGSIEIIKGERERKRVHRRQRE